jgi:hypothetical protein
LDERILSAELARDPIDWHADTVQAAILALDTELRLRTAKRPLVRTARKIRA